MPNLIVDLRWGSVWNSGAECSSSCCCAASPCMLWDIFKATGSFDCLDMKTDPGLAISLSHLQKSETDNKSRKLRTYAPKQAGKVFQWVISLKWDQRIKSNTGFVCPRGHSSISNCFMINRPKSDHKERDNCLLPERWCLQERPIKGAKEINWI